MNTHSSGCDSSVIFPLVSPTIKIISHRGRAAFGLHVVSIFHLAFFFLKSSASTSFPQIRFSVPYFRSSSAHCTLYPSRFAMHLRKDPGILALCNIPMAVAVIVRLSSRSAVAEACALVSKRSPHLSLLHVGLCSQQQQASPADTGGGGGLAEAMTSHRNDCSPFWTEGSPV